MTAKSPTWAQLYILNQGRCKVSKIGNYVVGLQERDTDIEQILDGVFYKIFGAVPPKGDELMKSLARGEGDDK